MDEKFVPVNREVAVAAVEAAFEKGSSATFFEALKTRLQDPLVPFDPKTATKDEKRKYHPLLWTLALALLGTATVVLVFSFKA